MIGRSWFNGILALTLGLVMMGCGGETKNETGDAQTSQADGSADTGGAGPTVTSFEITPSQFTSSDSGMTDEYIEVTLRVTGFDTPVSEVKLFIVENDRVAPNNPNKETTVDGQTIRVSNIQKTWFQGMDPGTYTIGATITAESGATMTDTSLGEIEVTE